VNSILNIFLDRKDQIRCKPQGDMESLWLGDLRIFASDDQLEAIRGAIELRLHEKFSQRKPAPDPFVARFGEEVDREITESTAPYPDRSIGVIDPEEMLSSMAETFEVHRETK
jgi:hypothetical protein